MLRYFLPSPQYQPWLTIHTVLDGLQAPTLAQVPAMLPNLHIRLKGTSSYVFADGQRIEAAPVVLIGPTNAAYRVELSADATVLAAGLLPLGWLSLIRFPATELADRLIDGTDFWGEGPCALALEKLTARRIDGGHTSIVENLLSSVGRAPRNSDLVAVVDHWLEASPELSIDDLSRSLGIGRRHLQRMMLEVYGAPPKALAMKYRALRAAASMATNRQAILMDALPGYADQAHLTRDFRRFIGVPPGTFIRERASVTAGTFAGRHLAGAIRPLALWS